MTDSDVQTETWAPIPGAGYYEASDHGGRIRSVPRTIGDRFYEGKLLTPKKTGTSRYWQVKLSFDNGTTPTVPVGVLVLRAHRGMPKPGQQCCHTDDNPDNNDLANLRWDWPTANQADRRRNHPPKPRPVKECIRCGTPFTGNGRRCHPCVVATGVLCAKRLQAGAVPSAVAEEIGYPVTVAGVDGVITLAQRHGGYGLPWSQSVKARLRSWFAGGDAP